MKNTQPHLLRAARLSLPRPLTQQQLADFAAVSLSTIESAERGEPISIDSIQRICDYLQKTAGELGLKRAESGEAANNAETATIPPLKRFLSMEADQLIKRYIGEKEKLLELKIDGINWTIPEVVVVDNSQSRLPLHALHVQLDESYPEYKIPAKIAGKAADVLEEIGHYFYDSTTIRLNGIQEEAHSITLMVAKAHFLQYVATNYAMDALLKEKGWTRSLRDTVHPTTQLCRLEESLLANHIGVNVLVFTLDNYLVIPFRSKEHIATWQQTISPSISGATSYDDDMWNFRAGPVASWIREGREELGISNSDFTESSDIFLGITRDLLRGGKPEMFFLTQLNITREALEQKFRKARDRWENRELRWLEFTDPLTPPTTEYEHATFLQEFLHLLDRYQDQLSRPAQVNLALWFKYMWGSHSTLLHMEMFA